MASGVGSTGVRDGGRLEFRVLGPLEVLADGRPVGLPHGRLRRVLGILLCNANRSVSADRLADGAWNGTPPMTARTQVQGFVSVLRRRLRIPGALLTSGPGYLLRTEPGALDVDVFREQVGAARQAYAAGDLARAADCWRRALSLWHGPPFDGIDALVLEQEAARLEDERLVAVEEYGGAELALGRPHLAAATLAPLATQHPLREQLHYLLITALYRSGRRGDAVLAYRRIRHSLVEELGVEPRADLRDLPVHTLTKGKTTVMDRRTALSLGLAGAAGIAAELSTSSGARAEGDRVTPDSTLAAALPGDFRSERARVNGCTLHYVVGGQGSPLILLPGWPQTWWVYHRIMPELARHHRVIAVDLRGMGGSDRPWTGYDKKTMAADIAALATHLGYRQVDVAGHDIGSMVAFSFAVNHPELTRKVAVLEVPHPDKGLFDMKLLPESPGALNLWWFAFNQLRGLPEQLVAGRSRYLVDWIFDHVPQRPAAIDEFDRGIYAQAYASPDAIRASNGWYQSWYDDISDFGGYGKVTAPMLGIGTDQSYSYLQYVWPAQGTDVRVVQVAGSNHFVIDEQPAAVTALLRQFFDPRK